MAVDLLATALHSLAPTSCKVEVLTMLAPLVLASMLKATKVRTAYLNLIH